MFETGKLGEFLRGEERPDFSLETISMEVMGAGKGVEWTSHQGIRASIAFVLHSNNTESKSEENILFKKLCNYS